MGTLLYIVVCFCFHPLIGWTVLGAVVVFVAMTVAGEAMLRSRTQEATAANADRSRFLEIMRRNAGLVQALGLRQAMDRRWRSENDRALDEQQSSGDTLSGFGAVQRGLRTLLQSGLLALGAWLVIQQEATGGVMLAATISGGAGARPPSTC